MIWMKMETFSPGDGIARSLENVALFVLSILSHLNSCLFSADDESNAILEDSTAEAEESGKRSRKRDSYLRRKAIESAANKSHRYSSLFLVLICSLAHCIKSILKRSIVQ
jgi:hypothetical protein